MDANGSSNYVSLEMEKAKVAVRSQTLSANDLLEAEVSIIRYSQQQRFKEEIVADQLESLWQETVSFTS